MNKVTFNLFIVFFTLSFTSYSTEFNAGFIRSSSKVDLANFSKSNFVDDGEYRINVYLNGLLVKESSIEYENNKPCISDDLLELFPINEVGYSIYKKTNVMKGSKNCYQIEKVKYTKVISELGKGKLEIVTPHKYIAKEYRNGFVPEKLWNDGISALFFDYNIDYFTIKKGKQWDSDFYLYGVAGFNFDAFRLRANYQSSSDLSGKLTSIYGYIPIRKIKSKLTFGQTSFNSDINATFPMRGVRLESEQQMLPSNIRGYSPIIAGTVSTDAKITIRQNGNILKIIDVNAGPYLIDDIAPESQSFLDVEVRLINGEVQKYQVNGADTLYLTRPNHFRYRLSAGTPESSVYAYTPTFLAAEASYGLNNTISLFSSTILSEKYQSLALGSGLNFGLFGAISTDLSQAKASMKNGLKKQGMSYGLSYNQTFDIFGSNVRVTGGYRSFEQYFYDFDVYLNAYDQKGHYNEFQQDTRRQDQTYFSVMRNFGETHVYLSYTSNNYWDKSHNNTRYDLSVSHPLKINDINAYLSMSAYQSKNAFSRLNAPSSNDQGWSLGITIPIGSNHHVSAQTQTFNERLSQNITYTGNNSRDASHYRLNFDVLDGESHSLGGRYSKDFPFISTSIGGSYRADNYSQLNANLAGSVLLSQYGLAYSRMNTGSSRMLIESNVAGVTINGHSNDNEQTNTFGLALVNGITPYHKNYSTIDFKSLPEDIEVLDSIQSIALTDGAIGYQYIRSRSGSSFMATLKSDQDIPFGAQVVDEVLNQEIAIVGEGSVAYLIGVNKNSNITVSWGQNQSCRLLIDGKVLNSNESIRDINCF
ncbi:fimbria/pilus outer membrane usher protein [Vibrio sagamiensis]|uniref:Fimbrial protein SteB n=2 Tax=Vibrio sagamiensis TaxID=512650 RepID=A0A511QFZ7_9VIBR|nr:fimbria/pilus outer membrane usher protein [Vibrio sagamiensis]GEM76229.1 fimbrial protein SteB [Vibrio sagamiensis NBRC 104589]